MILLVAVGAPVATAGHLGGGGVDIPVIRIILSLIACLTIAALAILFLFLRQRGGKPLRMTLGGFTSRQAVIDVVEVRRLSLHGDICVVRHDGCEYLLLIQSGGSLVLRRRDLTTEGAVAA